MVGLAKTFMLQTGSRPEQRATRVWPPRLGRVSGP